MRLLVILLSLSLVGCFESPVEHEHTLYKYSISYGKDKDHLDQVLTAQCTTYYHGLISNMSCPYSTDQIGRYICAVDNKLYLKTSLRSYKSVSTSVTQLDNMYCRIDKTVIDMPIKYLYTDSFFSEDTDVPKS